MSPTPSFSVVIPTYRRPDALSATLRALLSVDYPTEKLDVIVVDDGADESTESVVLAYGDGAIAVRYVSQERRGAAAARNAGARAASGELILFCDDDVIVEPDHLSRHAAARERIGDPLVNGVSSLVPATLAAFSSTPFGRLRLELEQSYERDADRRALGGHSFETAFVSARNLAMRRELFWDLGGFDEDFPYAGAEDQDLSLRARCAGFLLVRDHSIRVQHNEQTSTLRQFCVREERSAQTIVVLARKFPEEAAERRLLTQNRYIARRDGPGLVAKKLAKSLLSGRPVLLVLHRISDALERVPVPESVRHRLYRGLVALHIFRGVRAGLAKER